MAKAKNNSGAAAQPQPTFTPREARPRWATGAAFLILGTLALVALLSYRDGQELAEKAVNVPPNLVGSIGVWLAHYLVVFLGLAAWCFPFALFWVGGMHLFGLSAKLTPLRVAYLLIATLCTTALLSMSETQFQLVSREYRERDEAARTAVAGDPHAPFVTPYFDGGLGGYMGGFLYRGLLMNSIGSGGSALILVGVLSALAYLLFHDNLFRLLVWSIKESKVLERRGTAAKEVEAAPPSGKAPAPAPSKAPAPTPKPGAPAAPPPASGPKPLPPGAVKGGPPPNLPKTVPTGSGVPKPVAPAPVMTEPEPAPDDQRILLPKPKEAVPLAPGGPATPADLASLMGGVEPPPEGDEPVPTAPAPIATPTAPTGPSLRKPGSTPPGVPPPAAAGGGLKLPTRATGPSADHTSQLKVVQAEVARKAINPVPERKGNYQLPSLKLLREAEEPDDGEVNEDHTATAELIQRTLAEFQVKVTLGEVHAGPVITRYDVYPAAGVRVEKIAGLDRNLALGLKAMSVRVLAPVPGKGCVGIEVPNKRPQSVFLREIIESEDWANSKAEIPIALGREVSGKPLINDLTRMPHLLIAGATGSGKTVCINAIVASLLYRATPDDIRFVMVDPKIVEMQAYNVLPHMLIPVVTDPKKVPSALKYLTNEMERRYQLFAKVGVRNIAGFNLKRAKARDDQAQLEKEAAEMDAAMTPEERAAVSNASPTLFDDLEIPEKLPYIVVIIDELADLMMVAPADIETGVARLAQLARAAGIHLIIATQRPSVNVITGVIKANLPSRIAFKVAAKVDSRTILDGNGADQLIGRGDMLFLPPGASDLVRAQGAFVADEEINGIVEFLKVNGAPKFDSEFQRSLEESEEDEEGGGEGDESLEDDMLPEALEVLRATKRASTSMLQRRLRIGYNRAARIMEIMEKRGIVGPENGAQPREILKDLDSVQL